MARCNSWYTVTATAAGSDIVQCVKPENHGKVVPAGTSQMKQNQKLQHLWVSKDGTDRETWTSAEERWRS